MSNRHRVIIELTYADDRSTADIDTANYAATLRSSLALDPNVTASVRVESGDKEQR